ncbi:ABC transporter permease [Carboxydochorda subterranea]|uniref:ABC transporter permease n=1 Tax=Carboxydichorda subterranea TaxID=3109565 RepID=A0ABZ1BVR0_9FIRM|nr:ABC transporter permease [Limnochorda sp. L945t]WRP16761.1 ABC transporter permease [Limnochorda sp. L945t]
MKVIFHVLRAHWGRSLMAVLQIGVAVGAVVAIVATGIPTLMGTGMGSAQLLEASYSAVGQEVNQFTQETIPVFTPDDVGVVVSQAEAVEAAAIFSPQTIVLVQAGQDVYATRGFAAVTPQLARIAGLEMVAGSFFTDADIQEREARVAAVSEPLARMLFGSAQAAVGQTLTMRPLREAMALMGFAAPGEQKGSEQSPQSLRVVGVYRPLTGDAVFQDLPMMLPATANPAMGETGSGREPRYSALYVKPKPGRVQEAQESVRLLLAPRVEQRAADPRYRDRIAGRTYELTVREPFTSSTLRSILSWQVAVTAGVGLLAAVVGGIAVLTVSLVNVTEQVRAIALRRALGATRRRVLGEILAQSLVLSGLGGLVGILLAWPIERLLEPALPTVSFLGGRLGEAYVALGWMIAVPAGLLLALGIGTLAGLYPAWDASRTAPAEAWREVA